MQCCESNTWLMMLLASRTAACFEKLLSCRSRRRSVLRVVRACNTEGESDGMNNEIARRNRQDLQRDKKPYSDENGAVRSPLLLPDSHQSWIVWQRSGSPRGEGKPLLCLS